MLWRYILGRIMAMPRRTRETETQSLEMPPENLALELADAYKKGYGIVQLLGAGISVEAGVPPISVLGKYLKGCIQLVLDGAFFPHEHEWPEIAAGIEREAGANAPVEPNNLLKRFKANRTYKELQKASEAAAVDWRTSLHFLSRIRRNDDMPYLAGATSDTTDSFFRFLTENRHPTAVHFTAANLALLPGCNIILTPNFDDFLEHALDRIHARHADFMISQLQELPILENIERDVSIIHLHGGRAGLRADLSLDEEPTHEDSAKFNSYFADSGTPKAVRAHLLVLGVGGADYRIQKLIYNAAAQFSGSEPLRIYWVVYFKSEIEAIKQTFDNLRGTEHADSVLPSMRFILSKTPDKLLLRIYQHITYSLPIGGTNLATPWHSASPPRALNKGDLARGACETEEIQADYKKWLNEPANASETLCRVCAIDAGVGTTSLFASYFREPPFDAASDADMHASDTDVHWIEASELYDETDLLCTLYIRIARACGEAPAYPLIAAQCLLPDENKDELPRLLNAITDLLRKYRRRHYVVVNLRNKPMPHDRQLKYEIKLSSVLKSLKELKRLQAPSCSNDSAKIFITVLVKQSTKNQDFDHAKFFQLPPGMCEEREIARKSDIEAWRHTLKQEKLEFLVALRLARGPFHGAALVSQGFMPNMSNETDRIDFVISALRDAAECGLIKLHSGLLFSMPTSSREMIKKWEIGVRPYAVTKVEVLDSLREIKCLLELVQERLTAVHNPYHFALALIEIELDASSVIQICDEASGRRTSELKNGATEIQKFSQFFLSKFMTDCGWKIGFVGLDKLYAYSRERSGNGDDNCAEGSGTHRDLHRVWGDWYLKLYLDSNDPFAAMESIHHRWRFVLEAISDAFKDQESGESGIPRACISWEQGISREEKFKEAKQAWFSRSYLQAGELIQCELQNLLTDICLVKKSHQHGKAVAYRDRFEEINSLLRKNDSTVAEYGQNRMIVRFLRLYMNVLADILVVQKHTGREELWNNEVLKAECDFIYLLAREVLRRCPRRGGWSFYMRESADLKSVMAKVLALSERASPDAKLRISDTSDAQRRIFDSMAYLNRLSFGGDKLGWCINYIRLADILLLKADMAGEKAKSCFSSSSLELDSRRILRRELLGAHLNCERAQYNLRDIPSNSYWTTYLCELRLHLGRAAVSSGTALGGMHSVVRNLSEEPARRKYLEHGLALVTDDIYRAARLVNLYLDACKANSGQNEEWRTRTRERLSQIAVKRGTDGLPECIMEYARICYERVGGRLDALFEVNGS